MSWKMFKLACEYCQMLDLHNLDSNPQSLLSTDETGNAVQDERRKDLWEVIQIDLFFRLTYDMPAVITNNPWKINLPWGAPDSSPIPEGLESIAFLTNSKVTLITARYFAMLDGSGEASIHDLMARTEAMCQEIFAAIEEWSLVSVP
jgi:hypothetical protein